MILTGERRSCQRKPCPSATLPKANLTFADLGSNQGLRGERPATDPMYRGPAFCRLEYIRTMYEAYSKSKGR